MELSFYRNGEMEKAKEEFKMKMEIFNSNILDIYKTSYLIFQVGFWLSIMVFCHSLEIQQVSCFIEDMHFIFDM